MNKLIPPWTADQVDALNEFQRLGHMHPFTCGGVVSSSGISKFRTSDRSDKAHQDYAARHGTEPGLLVATMNGWVCPVCPYEQNWCWDMMADKKLWPENPFPKNEMV